MANKKEKKADFSKVVPYSKIFEEMGMISQTYDEDRELFSVAYKIDDAEAENVLSADPVQANENLLALLDFRVNYQFFTINKQIDEEDYLDRVMLPFNPKYQDFVDSYNDIMIENVRLGHNNMIKEKYIVFSEICYSPDEAVSKFKELEEKATKRFDDYYHIKIHRLSISERLELIYNCYNMGGDSFGKRAGMEGNVDVKNLKKLKMTSKDLVKPRNVQEFRNYLVLNDNLFSRTFFISNFPSVMSSSLISELTNISSRMIFSSYYENLNADVGFDITKSNVSKNTIVRNLHDKTTLQDRKSGKITKKQELREASEQAYFDQAALDVLTDAKASTSDIYLGSFLITIYSDNLADLERDSQLLILSASKFSFQIKTLDYKQLDGISSSLPLANNKVNVKRVFSVSKMALLSPFDVQASLRNDGYFVGMNSINDNLIMINRQNLSKPCGLISGIRNSGKTFQMKREIVNNAITSNDLIFVISNSKEKENYSDFIKRLGGYVFDQGAFDPMLMANNYGFILPDKKFKEIFLTAVFSNKIRLGKMSNSDERLAAEEKLRNEIENLVDNVSSWKDIDDYLYSSDNSSYLNSSFHKLSTNYTNGKVSQGGRINYFVTASVEDMMIVLDRIWNLSIEYKKKNISSWIFIDCIDDIISTPEGVKYFSNLLNFSNILHNPITAVIQDASIFSFGEEKYLFKEIIPYFGYFKLLNQNPSSRKLFAEELNLPQSLLPFITNCGVGNGIIVDQANSIPFNDNLKEISNKGNKIKGLY